MNPALRPLPVPATCYAYASMFYLDLFRALGAAGVDYVVVGGLALNLHGVERATMDVDLAIALDESNLRRAVGAFQALDLRPVAPVSWTDIVKPGQLERWRSEKHMRVLGLQTATGVAPTVDVLTSLPLPFEALKKNSVAKNLAGLTVPVAGIDDLIALKRDTGRATDIADVEALEKLKRVKAGRS
jgi:Nucleotidyltransferase of unknown function (DUF6036)